MFILIIINVLLKVVYVDSCSDRYESRLFPLEILWVQNLWFYFHWFLSSLSLVFICVLKKTGFRNLFHSENNTSLVNHFKNDNNISLVNLVLQSEIYVLCTCIIIWFWSQNVIVYGSLSCIKINVYIWYIKTEGI